MPRRRGRARWRCARWGGWAECGCVRLGVGGMPRALCAPPGARPCPAPPQRGPWELGELDQLEAPQAPWPGGTLSVRLPAPHPGLPGQGAVAGPQELIQFALLSNLPGAEQGTAAAWPACWTGRPALAPSPIVCLLSSPTIMMIAALPLTLPLPPATTARPLPSAAAAGV